jgi:hypothetical protein
MMTCGICGRGERRSGTTTITFARGEATIVLFLEDLFITERTSSAGLVRQMTDDMTRGKD